MPAEPSAPTSPADTVDPADEATVPVVSGPPVFPPPPAPVFAAPVSPSPPIVPASPAVAALPPYVAHLELTAHDGGTRMELRASFDTREQMDQLLGIQMDIGMEQAMSQIDALLAA